MKKIISFLLSTFGTFFVIILLSLLLGACSSGNDTTESLTKQAIEVVNKSYDCQKNKCINFKVIEIKNIKITAADKMSGTTKITCVGVSFIKTLLVNNNDVYKDKTKTVVFSETKDGKINTKLEYFPSPSCQ